MAYVYVLRSLKNNKRYVGYTAKAPLEKLAEHNSGATRWTCQNGPFVLLHVEEFPDSQTARKRAVSQVRQGSRVVGSKTAWYSVGKEGSAFDLGYEWM